MSSCRLGNGNTGKFNKKFTCEIDLDGILDSTLKADILPKLKSMGWNFLNDLVKIIKNE